MEGPLLVLKAWFLTGALIWIYRRWFQQVAPPSPGFEAFCRREPVVGAILGVAGDEASVEALLRERLERDAAAIATLGGFPWPHYRLSLAIERRSGCVLLRVKRAAVVRTGDRPAAALASLLRDVLNELPEGAEAWLHRGAFDDGLTASPEAGWSVARGSERRPQLAALSELPPVLRELASPARGARAAATPSYLALENQSPFLLP
jgi:hypothetical protein